MDKRNLAFQFDTGNTSAELTARYVHEFPQQFASLKTEQSAFAGAGGKRQLPIYVLPKLVLGLGDATASFKNVRVLDSDRGVDPLDQLFGNLGQTLVKQFRSYTIDFRRMQLTLGENVR